MDERSPAPDADAELMLRVREGDQAAFRMLFEKHAGPLLGFVDRFFHNRAVSEEVVQEVFFRVYRARKKYRPKSKFTTWLYTIATRASLNELRRGVFKQRRQELGDADGAAPAVDQEVAGRRLQERVAGILTGLPEKQRAAFLLVRFGGRSYGEVAQILGLSESAVKSRIFRATDAVRRGLSEDGSEQ
jgi:RNA polymerase sigma-70 factor (ECF subfamily)